MTVTLRLGMSPDETLALLSRAHASLSLDASLDEMVAGVRHNSLRRRQA